MTKQNKDVCEHRHTIDTHPNCFLAKPWYLAEGERVGYLDIEASDLDANSGWMLSWAIKDLDVDGLNGVTYDYVHLAEFFYESGVVNKRYDERITKSLISEMQKYTCLVTYYGTGFDIPFIRSRALKLGIKFPHFGKIGHLDLYYHVRSKMKLSRNSLAVSTKFLGIDGKTRLDFDYWKLAAMGDAVSMERLLEHNIQDVLILQKLHKKLEKFSKFSRKSI